MTISDFFKNVYSRAKTAVRLAAIMPILYAGVSCASYDTNANCDSEDFGAMKRQIQNSDYSIVCDSFKMDIGMNLIQASSRARFLHGELGDHVDEVCAKYDLNQHRLIDNTEFRELLHNEFNAIGYREENGRVTPVRE